MCPNANAPARSCACMRVSNPIQGLLPRPRWWTGFLCRWVSPRCATSFDDVEDDAARFALMSWFFEENLEEFSPYAAAQAREGFQIIGTSGTVTTVAASHLGLSRYDRTKVDGLRMTSDQIDAVIRDYLVAGASGAPRGPAHRQGPAGADHVGIGDFAGADAALADRPAVGGGSRPARRVALCADVGGWGLGRHPVLRIRRCHGEYVRPKRTHPVAVSAICT